VNGAGKTTTFKMLTGDEIPSNGRAFINGFDLANEQYKANEHIGLQFNKYLI
jgi:ABC-type multidrug transport system ATPase subunit